MSRPNFHIVKGGFSGKAEKSSHMLSALKPSLHIEPYQLQLTFSNKSANPHGKATVISVGIGDLEFSELLSWIESCNAKKVIDIRLSNSFHAPGFSYENFMAALSRCGVQYEHRMDLANRFLGESFDTNEILDRYKNYLLGNKSILLNLRDTVRHGPIVLLGWSFRQDEIGEQDILISVLQTVDPAFQFDVHMVPRKANQHKEKHTASATLKYVYKMPDHGKINIKKERRITLLPRKT